MSTLYIRTADEYKNNVWGINSSGSFAKLADNWMTMTSDARKTLFSNTNGQEPTLSQLMTISPFYFISFMPGDNDQTYSIEGLPTPQIVLPTELMDISSCEAVTGINITTSVSGSASIKVAMTTDGSTYKVYSNGAWSVIDVTDKDAFAASGMPVSTVNGLPAEDILTLTGNLLEQTADQNKLGFAYLLTVTSASESCEVQGVTLTVTKQGEWSAMAPFADYAYSYPDASHMKVTFAAAGAYKIIHEK